MMPNDLPHWKTCYHYFRLWANLGYWERIHHAIRDMARLAVGKKAPTDAIIDSQSVRTASQSRVRGYDAAKKITGRKRHVLVDTLGNILALKVTAADVQDRDGAELLLNVLTMAFGWLMLIWADGGKSPARETRNCETLGQGQRFQDRTQTMDRGTHVRMVDPIAAVGSGLRSEDRTLGSHDLPVDDQANACQNRLLDIFKTVSKDLLSLRIWS